MPRLIPSIVAVAMVLAATAAVQTRAQEVEGLPKPVPEAPSAEFPFESRFVEVLGSKLHYIEEGEGDPILFLHGNPTSSYLWRNIIPYLSSQGRVIAVDNIGFGKSDKPDIGYRYKDHIRYIDGFIEALELKNITLVGHDWGAAFAFDYASRHPGNVAGIAYMEALMVPRVPVPSMEIMGGAADVFTKFRTPGVGEEMVIENNFFVEQMLPGSIVRDLSEAEMEAYRAPFVDKAARHPTLIWPREVPIGGEPADVLQAIERFNRWILSTDMPMLLVYAKPGILNTPAVAEWQARNIRNLETHYVGLGLHYLQEDHPERIGLAIADWHRRLQK